MLCRQGGCSCRCRFAGQPSAGLPLAGLFARRTRKAQGRAFGRAPPRVKQALLSALGTHTSFGRSSFLGPLFAKDPWRRLCLTSGAPRGGADSQKPQGLGGWRGASYARRQGRSDPKSRSGARTVSGDARCGRGRRVWAAPKGQYCPPLNSARGAPRRGAPADRHHDPPTTVLLVACPRGPFRGRREPKP